MKARWVCAGVFLALLVCILPATPGAMADGVRFEVTVAPGLSVAPKDGRLFVLVSPTNQPEPRLLLGEAGPEAPAALARDVAGFSSQVSAVLDQRDFAYPLTNLASWPAGDFFVQALLDCDTDLRSPNAPGNLYSEPRRLHLDPTRDGTVPLILTRQIPPEPLPADTAQLRFVKLPSPRLSQFYGRPIFLRAGVLLPRDYAREPARHYPLWIRIGGLNTRFTSVTNLADPKSEFGKVWQAASSPRFILLQLDGAGPNGDPYQVNSANNGPYGDALVHELIPEIERRFRARGQPQARVLSGTSTGGWVALALQVFYPDTFNGAWASCPDPVDFRAFELVNLYADTNAYLNSYGNERPSERNLFGDVVLTMRREVGLENLLGGGNSYERSGQQWGEWHMVFSPRGSNGLPARLWDPVTGAIDHRVAEHWKQYDLRLVLEQNWLTLAPKLQGKLHIDVGEADQYFLNYAVHRLEAALAKAKPALKISFAYGPGQGHGWSHLTLRALLEQMRSATREPR